MMLFLAAGIVYADDLADQTTFGAIDADLRAIGEGLGEERRKPLAEQDAERITRLMRQLDGVRQRLGSLEPSAPTLRTWKLNLEADLDRLTSLANDMWRALPAPEFVATRRAKEEEARSTEAIRAKLLQIEKERGQEASRPIGQQRRAVYERLITDASIVLAEANQKWVAGDKPAQELRRLAWEHLQRVQSNLYAVDVHEHTRRLEREAAAKEQTRQQEVARLEQARRAAIRARGWSKAIEDAVVRRSVVLGMTPRFTRPGESQSRSIERSPDSASMNSGCMGWATICTLRAGVSAVFRPRRFHGHSSTD